METGVTALLPLSLTHQSSLPTHCDEIVRRTPAGRLTLDTGDEHKGAATPSPSPEDEIAFSFELAEKWVPGFTGTRS